MSIQLVNGLQWVRARPDQFFPHGRIDPMSLLAWVMCDVLKFGSGDCRIAARSGWWVVVSDSDWLSHNEVSVGDLFCRVVPAPEHGEHSMRAEVLLNAFAADVVTGVSDVQAVVKGEPPDRRLIRDSVDSTWSRRFVAFRLAEPR